MRSPVHIGALSRRLVRDLRRKIGLGNGNAVFLACAINPKMDALGKLPVRFPIAYRARSNIAEGGDGPIAPKGGNDL
jgi:hypothetical protein